MVGSGVYLAGEHSASTSYPNQEQGVAASVRVLTRDQAHYQWEISSKTS